jgi:hypothetical protein
MHVYNFGLWALWLSRCPQVVASTLRRLPILDILQGKLKGLQFSWRSIELLRHLHAVGQRCIPRIWLASPKKRYIEIRQPLKGEDHSPLAHNLGHRIRVDSDCLASRLLE